MSSAYIFRPLTIIFDVFVGFWGLGSLIDTFLRALPNSRTSELEGLLLSLVPARGRSLIRQFTLADKIGLVLSSKACYDPRAAPA
jgi:hypothetical protein